MDQILVNWMNTRKALFEIVQTNTYKGIQLKQKDKLALAVAIVELGNHMNRNIFALEDRFKYDLESDFVTEVKDSFDFDWMVDLKESIKDETKSMAEAMDEVEMHGNSALKFLLLR